MARFVGLVVVFLVAGCTAQYAAQQPTPVPILRLSNEINPDGSFQYGYETGDGTSSDARGYLKNAGNPELESQVIEGQYSYVGPDGQRYTVTYVADENGFRAQGAHLPTSPPIPAEIQRSLQPAPAAPLQGPY